MTQRKMYTASMATTCTTFGIAGIMWPLSDLARHAGRLDIFWWLEASSFASMIAAILVLCFGLKTGGHFQSHAQSEPRVQQQAKSGLLLFAVIMVGQLIFALIGKNLAPSGKLVADMVQHSLPLVFAAAVWWIIWKPNDRVLT